MNLGNECRIENLIIFSKVIFLVDFYPRVSFYSQISTSTVGGQKQGKLMTSSKVQRLE